MARKFQCCLQNVNEKLIWQGVGYDRRKLKVNAEKSKMMVFEKKEFDQVSFGELCSVRKQSELNC